MERRDPRTAGLAPREQGEGSERVKPEPYGMWFALRAPLLSEDDFLR